MFKKNTILNNNTNQKKFSDRFKKIILFLFLSIFVFSGLLYTSNIVKAQDEIIFNEDGSIKEIFNPTTQQYATPAQIAKENTPFNASGFLFKCAAVAVVLIIAAYTFGILAIMLAAKYAILVVLYILSPLAFCCWVFPSTRSIWTKWWQTFIQWSFVGVSTAFFIYLAMSVLTSSSKPGTPTDLNVLFVCFIFIYIGYKITSSAAPVVSASVMGMAKGVGAMAMGAVGGAAMGAGKIADRLTGNRASAGIQKVKNSYGKLLEGAGLRKIGGVDSANEKRVNEGAGDMAKSYAAAKASGDQGTINRIQKMAKTGYGAKGAQAMKVVTDAKDLGSTFGGDMALASQRIKYAESNGAAGLRDIAVKTNPNFGKDRMAIKKAVQSTSPLEASRWSADTLTPEVYNSLTTAHVKTIGERGSQELVDKVKSFKPASGGGANYRAAVHDAATSNDRETKKTFIDKRNQIASDSNFI